MPDTPPAPTASPVGPALVLEVLGPPTLRGARGRGAGGIHLQEGWWEVTCLARWQGQDTRVTLHFDNEAEAREVTPGRAFIAWQLTPHQPVIPPARH